jgi:tetratricopeptide (TPR) repeat protein
MPVPPGEPTGIELAIWETPVEYSPFAEPIGQADPRMARLVPSKPDDGSASRLPILSDVRAWESGGFVRLPPLPDALTGEAGGPMLMFPADAVASPEASKSTPPAPLPAAATATVEELPVPAPGVEKETCSVSPGLPTREGFKASAQPAAIPRPTEEESWRDSVRNSEVLSAPTEPSQVQTMPSSMVRPQVRGTRSESLELVAKEADKHTRCGLDLAGRGAYYAARAEFVAALRLIAQGLDSNEATNTHSRALADALIALRECEDFVPRGGRVEADLDLSAILRTHRTPVFQESQPEGLTSLEATRRYLTFVQQQVAVAAGQEVAGSMALYAMGKLHSALAGQPAAGVPCAEGKAMAFFQASLLVYPANYMASNELGVLLARGGRYADARIALEHSVSTTSHAPGWRNLAVVYRTLGENQLAQQADQMAVAVESQAGRASAGRQSVRWIDSDSFAKTFAETPAARQPLPARSAPANTAAAPAEKRAASRWWPFDKSSNPETRQ